MKRLLWLALAAAVLAPVGAAAAPTEPPAIVLNPVADGFSDPLTLTHAGDDRLFVVENAGLIRIVEGDGTVLPTPFLDISDKTSTESERGLLGLAFHPDYAANGTFFIYYTGLGSPTFDSIVARYTVSAGDPNVANPDSEVIVLTEPQNRDNHNGGQMAFGPDGYLYIALGDGGGGGDPDQNAQDVTTLKGTITRIDVDGTDQGDGLPEYDIPPDNPDLSGVDPDYRPEIWAYGLRNPWRFSFDSLTGDLYIADVGQGAWEEINYQPPGAQYGGRNYGWPILEATHCFPPSVPSCDTTGLTLPVIEYPHNADNNRSVTGGYVYRGTAFPDLQGIYFFTDYISGRIWATVPQGSALWQFAEVLDTPYFVASMGQGADGALYVLDYSAGGLYRLAQALDAPTLISPEPFATLTERTVTLTWDPVELATSYLAGMQTQGITDFKAVTPAEAGCDISGPCSVTFSPEEWTALNGADYQWGVRAVNAVDTSQSTSAFSTVFPPRPVALISPADGATESAPVTFTWQQDPDATEYLFGYRLAGESPVTTPYDPAAICADGVCSVTENLPAGAYLWGVRASNANGSTQAIHSLTVQ